MINMVARQITAAANTINALNHLDTSFSFSHAEAMPMEYATWSDGHTPVLVSVRYRRPMHAVRKLSLGNTSGRRSCRLG